MCRNLSLTQKFSSALWLEQWLQLSAGTRFASSSKAVSFAILSSTTSDACISSFKSQSLSWALHNSSVTVCTNNALGVWVLSKTMLHDNLIAWLTIFLIFSNFVPLFMDLWLRLVGAENHRSLHWSWQGTSISQFNASNISYSFKVTLVSVIYSCSNRQTSATHVTLSPIIPCAKIQVQRRFTTTLFVTYCFGKSPHTGSKISVQSIFSFHPPTLSIKVNAYVKVAFETAACKHLP